MNTIDVLIVDDNSLNVDVLKLSLTKIKTRFTLSVDSARNGEKAVEMAAQKHYDIIFMDLQMPVMSGSDASFAIRENENQQMKETPSYIVALTASHLSEYENLLEQSGMDDFLLKPFTLSHLTEIILRIGEKKHPLL